MISTLPDVLPINDVKILNVVDLPAPFGPNNPKISFLFTPKVISLTANRFVLYYFYKCKILIGVILVPFSIY